MLDGEAIVLRPDSSSDFEALKSRHGQAEAILVAYDIMEMDGQDVRPEPLEERRKRLAKLLSRSNKGLRDGIQLSEAITGATDKTFLHSTPTLVVTWLRIGQKGIKSSSIDRCSPTSPRCSPIWPVTDTSYGIFHLNRDRYGSSGI